MDATPHPITDSDSKTTVHPDPKNAAGEAKQELSATERYSLDILTTGAAKLFPLLNDMDCAVSQLKHGSRGLVPTNGLNRLLNQLAATFDSFSIDALRALSAVEKEVCENYPQYLDGDEDSESKKDVIQKIQDMTNVLERITVNFANARQERSGQNMQERHTVVGPPPGSPTVNNPQSAPA